MVEVYNDVSSIEELVNRYERIYLYGAGASCRLLLMSFGQDILKGHIKCVIDENKDLSNTTIDIGEERIVVKDIESIADEFIKDSSKVILLTPVFSSVIIESLDRNKIFDNAKVYLLPMTCIKEKGDMNCQIKSENWQVIPKIIHYFWIGNKTLPDEYRKNIEGWKKLNPDYEIRCWSEDNYNFNRIAYVREAYELGSSYLMFATDYARLDVLYRYGGIYLDTDVELLKPLDDLLYNKGFIGIEENAQVNSGSGMGSMPGHPMVRRIMKYYEDSHFLDNSGSPQIKYNTYFETKCFIDNGYKMINRYQMINDMVCFPRDYFMPLCFAGMEDLFTERTVSIHKINPDDYHKHRKAYNKWKDRVKESLT